MAAEPNRRRFTVAEYYQMGTAGLLGPEDRVELIEGEIIEMPPIGDPHAWCLNRLIRLFVPGVGDGAIVAIQNQPVTIILLLDPERRMVVDPWK